MDPNYKLQIIHNTSLFNYATYTRLTLSNSKKYF